MILGFAFYWFEWRPTKARIDCLNRIAEGELKISGGDFDGIGKFDAMMSICLAEKGIKE